MRSLFRLGICLALHTRVFDASYFIEENPVATAPGSVFVLALEPSTVADATKVVGVLLSPAFKGWAKLNRRSATKNGNLLLRQCQFADAPAGAGGEGDGLAASSAAGRET
jgi:hypothetical protein